jgi:hypothetical protein
MDEKVFKELVELFAEMADHLDFCGYGDQYERECARNDKLPQRVDNMRMRLEEVRLLVSSGDANIPEDFGAHQYHDIG